MATLAGLGMMLAGCCANNVCECPNEAQVDAIRIVFDSTSYKSRTELDTLVLVRYLRPKVKNSSAPLSKPETVTLIRTAAQAYDIVIINNATPFSQLGSSRLDAFNYVLRYYPGTKPKLRPSKLALVIDSVKLSGSFEGNGCCTCYTNSRKEVFARSDSAKTPDYNDLILRKAVLTVKR